ncbi:MAG: hypothetical protein LUH22_16150 [Bacteroides sp.]|nr:hypothetical protein [Bacteroides sp.]
MKKKKMNVERMKNVKLENSAEEINQEDILDLDSLLDIQGGTEDHDSDTDTDTDCGLGCFTGGVFRKGIITNEGE